MQFSLCYNVRMEKKYYKYKIENLLVISRIITVYHFELDKNFKNEEEAHDFWEMVYVERGDVICTANGKQFALHEGEAYFHCPHEMHTLSGDGKTPPTVVIISFTCKSEAVHFFEKRHIPADRTTTRLVRWIVEEGRESFDLNRSTPASTKMPLLEKPALGGLQLIKNYLESLLIRIMRTTNESAENPATFLFEDKFEGHISRQTIAIMKENLHSRLTIEDICKQLNYNKSYVFKHFKADTGYPVMTYFTYLKIEHAKRLLRTDNLTISQIAEALAFDTPNYFSKTFKKETGMTPSAYRKLYSVQK